MKKKPEVYTRAGKSNVTLNNFLNNLKENDLHYENKQITQCVFLGVLRLKPVPTVFSSNNVPSVSKTVVERKLRKFKNNNSNKEINKNASRKNDINKVISGKIKKKNPIKIKASVKKVVNNKPKILKIDLNMIKRKHIEASTSREQEKTLTIVPELVTNIVPKNLLSNQTITINRITNHTTVNPVENLFNKLKQKIDEDHNQPGPSKIFSNSKPTIEVCKINANKQLKSTVTNRKIKKSFNKKSMNHERLAVSLSPTSSSDSDIIRIRDDVISISSSNSNLDNIAEKTSNDVIIINEGPAKQKERMSPRKTLLKEDNEKDQYARDFILINDVDNSLKMKICSRPKVTEANKKVGKQIQDINNIVISEDLQNKNDVIVIDEIKEPRSKKIEEEVTEHGRETHLNKQSLSDIATSEEGVATYSKKNIIPDKKNSNLKGQKSSQLKTVHSIETPSGELNNFNNYCEERGVSEKTKPARRRLMPAAIPSIFLNTPMLLRSELAAKKTNTSIENKTKSKMYSSKFEKSDNALKFNKQEMQLQMLHIPNENQQTRGENQPEKYEVASNSSQASSNEEVLFVNEEHRLPHKIEKSYKRLLPLRKNIDKKNVVDVQENVINELNKRTKGTMQKTNSNHNGNKLKDCSYTVLSPQNTSTFEAKRASAVTSTKQGTLTKDAIILNADPDSKKSSNHPWRQCLPFDETGKKSQTFSLVRQTEDSVIAKVRGESVRLFNSQIFKQVSDKNLETVSDRDEVIIIDMPKPNEDVTHSYDFAHENKLSSSIQQPESTINISETISQKLVPNSQKIDEVILVDEAQTNEGISKSAQQMTQKRNPAGKSEYSPLLLKSRVTYQKDRGSTQNCNELNSASSFNKNIQNVEDDLVIIGDETECNNSGSVQKLSASDKTKNSMTGGRVRVKSNLLKSVTNTNNQEVINIDDEETNKNILPRSDTTKRNLPGASVISNPLIDISDAACEMTEKKSTENVKKAEAKLRQETLKSSMNISTGKVGVRVKEEIVIVPDEFEMKDSEANTVQSLQFSPPSAFDKSNQTSESREGKVKNVHDQTNECSIFEVTESVPTSNRTVTARLFRSDTTQSRGTEIVTSATIDSLMNSEISTQNSGVLHRSNVIQNPQDIANSERYVFEDTNMKDGISPRSLRSRQKNQDNKLSHSANPSRTLQSSVDILLKQESVLVKEKQFTENKSNQTVVMSVEETFVNQDQPKENISPRSAEMQQKDVERSKTIPQNEDLSTFNKSVEEKTKPFEKAKVFQNESKTSKKQSNFDEISVFTEKPSKKQREFSTRLLRSSHLSTNPNPKLLETEQVVVLIHEEPKLKQTSARSDNSSLKKNNSIPSTSTKANDPVREKLSPKVVKGENEVEEILGTKSVSDVTTETKKSVKNDKITYSNRSRRSERHKCLSDLRTKKGVKAVKSENLKRKKSQILPPKKEENGSIKKLSRRKSHSISSCTKEIKPTTISTVRSKSTTRMNPLDIQTSGRATRSKSQNLLCEMIKTKHTTTSPKRPLSSENMKRNKLQHGSSLKKNTSPSRSESRKTRNLQKFLEENKKAVTRSLRSNSVPRYSRRELHGKIESSESQGAPSKRTKSAGQKVKQEKPNENKCQANKLSKIKSIPSNNGVWKRDIQKSRIRKKKLTRQKIIRDTMHKEIIKNIIQELRKTIFKNIKLSDTEVGFSHTNERKAIEKNVGSKKNITDIKRNLANTTNKSTGRSDNIKFNVKKTTFQNKAKAKLPKTKKRVNIDKKSDSKSAAFIKQKGILKNPFANENNRKTRPVKVKINNEILTNSKVKLVKKSKKKLLKPKPSIVKTRNAADRSNRQLNKIETNRKVSPGKSAVNTDENVNQDTAAAVTLKKKELDEKVPDETISENGVTLPEGHTSKTEVEKAKIAENVLKRKSKKPDEADPVKRRQYTKRSCTIKNDAVIVETPTTSAAAASALENETLCCEIKVTQTEQNEDSEMPEPLTHIDGSRKKSDITIFDFDESEPVVFPLRFNSTPKKDRNAKPVDETNVNVTPLPIKQKLLDNIDGVKVKLYSRIGEPTSNDKVRSRSQAETSISSKAQSQVQDINDTFETKDVALVNADGLSSDTCPSSLKQESVARMVTEEALSSEQQTEEKISDLRYKTQPSQQVDTSVLSIPNEDEESDNERSEWMPREYAEYKFRYSARKMKKYKPVFKCKICNVIMPTYYKLKKHKREHGREQETKQNPYDCKQCGEAFSNVEDLTAHLENHMEVIPLDSNLTPIKSSIQGRGEEIETSSMPKKPKLLSLPPTKPDAKVKLYSRIEIPKNKEKETKAELCLRDEKQSKEIDDPDSSTVKTNLSPPKTCSSPLKQPTIIEMFSRALRKQKGSQPAAPLIEEGPPEVLPKEPPKKNGDEPPAVTEMLPPKSGKTLPPSFKTDERDCSEDGDSDNESRAEWIPEEYAEYKFKYSATKIMKYKPIFKCKICLVMMPSYYKLKKHKKEHEMNDNPYTCKQCSGAFNNVDDLTAHLRIHKGKHPYMCNKCNLGFWSKKAYDAHTPIHILKKVKRPVMKFRCDVCLKEFGKLCDVERHMRVHTGEKPCVCNICNKRFQQSHNLSKHLLTHLYIKPYHCEICNKQFGRNDVLNRHLLTHSMEKPIKCSVCAKGFIRQTQLNQHLKTHHPDVPLEKPKASGNPTVTTT